MADGMALPLDQTPDDPAAIRPEDQARARLRRTLVTLPFTPGELETWYARIDRAKKRITDREAAWDALLNEYEPVVNEHASAPDIKTNSHFRNIHTKSGQLFVQNPEVRLTPSVRLQQSRQIPGPPDPMTGQPSLVTLRASDALAIRQAVINQQLGPERIDASAVMDECIFDMQGYSGIACVQVEYVAYTLPAPNPAAQPDPLTGLVDPTAAPTIDVPIHQDWVAERFDAKQLLLDDELRTSNPRHARWIGREVIMSKRVAMRKYGLTEDELGQGTTEQDRTARTHQTPDEFALEDSIRLYLVWFKCAHFTDDGHPQKIYELVLTERYRDRPAVYRPWQHQTFDERGQLTDDSLDTFPIFIGSLRVKSSDPFPQADSAFTHALIKQLNTFRQQMVRLRDVAIGKYFYDTDAIDTKDLMAMRDGEVGAYIGMKPGAGLQGWDKIFYTTAQAKSTPDDWRTMALLKADMDETLGISANQAGVQTENIRSATETQVVQLNAQGRQQKERNRVVAFFLSWVRAIDILIFRYAVGDHYVNVVGPNGMARLEQWNREIGSGRFSYAIKPDSQLAVDRARDRQQRLAYYNAVAPDPLTNRPTLLRALALDFGEDPLETVLDPNAVNAQMMVAQATGLPGGQPPHPGGPASKHQAERSGRLPNAPNVSGPGDNRQERNPRPNGPA